MKRILTRAATLLVAAPLALAGLTGSASAGSITVPGCYGAESAIVCDPTVSWGVPAGVEVYEETVEVCAGTCRDVPVTLVRTTAGDPLAVCVSYVSRSGVPTSRCVTVPETGPIVEDVLETVDTLLDATDGVREILADAVANLAYSYCYEQVVIRCNSTVYNALRNVANLIRP